MAQHNEKPFEAELADYLQAHGWQYSEYGSGYDTQHVILPDNEVGLMRDETPKIARRLPEVWGRVWGDCNFALAPNSGPKMSDTSDALRAIVDAYLVDLGLSFRRREANYQTSHRFTNQQLFGQKRERS